MNSARITSSPLRTSLFFGSFLAVSTASGAIIYQHNFDGGSGTLNGVPLHTADGSLGGSAGAKWLAHESRYYADGSITSTVNSASAYVPFSPVSGYDYTITLSVAITSGNSPGWVALSLFDGTPITTGAFNTVSTTRASIGRRNNTSSGGTDLLRWEGPSNGGDQQHLHEPVMGIWNLSILLNTTDSANWTFRWLMQGDGNVEHTSGIYNLGTQTLSHIMISNNGNVSAELSGFSVTAVPEPSLTLLSAFGGFLVIRRHRRR
jgi:hypothetical protein